MLDLFLRHTFKFGLGGESIGDRLGLDFVDGDSAAVIGNLDDDVAAFVIGVECDRPGLGFAGCLAFGRRLDAMVA